MLDLADDAIISIDEDHRITLFNKGAERIFGYTLGEVHGRLLDTLLPDRLAELHRCHVEKFAHSPTTSRRMGDRSEILGRRKDGTEFPAEASISQVRVAGKRIFTVILRDVTARHEAEEKLRASLQEKEVLLREIHHRVKNNLQIISSLLGLQARTTSDDQIRSMFRESQRRIHAMALLHEMLYQSENLSDIDCHKYFERLSEHLFRSYGVSASRVHLRIDLDSVQMNLDVAVPCGLIVNELLSNALRHAFPEEAPGEVRIEIRRQGDHKMSLAVGDSGIGMPQALGSSTTKTLGLRLVRMLAEQLKANIKLSSRAGTEIKLTFPIPISEVKHVPGPNLDC